MDLLLANSYMLEADRKGERIEGPYAPLGPLYIAAILREKGYKVGLFDGTFASGLEGFSEMVRRERPAAVGVYNTVISRRTAVAMLQATRRLGVRAVSGGPDPSADPDHYLENGADVVGIGEGERTAEEIVQACRGERDLVSVKGIAFRDGDTRMRTLPRERIDDLDSLPLPARDLLDWPRYAAATRQSHGKSQLTVMTSRGCPFECTWCCKPIFGRKYRHRSARSVADEFAHLKATYRPDSVRIADDVFTINRKLAIATCQAIVDADAVIPFECLTRVDLVDEEVLDALKAAGCWRVYYGVESGSQRVLDAMKKGTKVEQVDQASQWMRERAMEQYWFLMYGYPPEDEDDLLATLRLLRRHRPEAWGVTVAYPLPQTEFQKEVAQRMDGQAIVWEKTRDNKVVWDADYPTAYYKACVWAAHAVYRASRLAHGSPSPITRGLDKATMAAATAGVKVLGRVSRRRPRERREAAPRLPMAGT